MIHFLALFQITKVWYKKSLYHIVPQLHSIICQTMKFEYIAKNPTISGVSRRVPGAGLEPARPYGQQILSLLRCRGESAVLSQYITNCKIS